jgi:hypothetical protein
MMLDKLLERKWKETVRVEFEVLSRRFLGVTKENHGNLCQDRRPPGPPIYRAGMLPTRTLRSAVRLVSAKHKVSGMVI